MAVPFDGDGSEQVAEALRMAPIEAICAELVRRAGSAAALATEAARLAATEHTPLDGLLELVAGAQHAAERATRMRDAVRALAPDTDYARDAGACVVTARLAAERCQLIRTRLWAQYQGGRA